MENLTVRQSVELMRTQSKSSLPITVSKVLNAKNELPEYDYNVFVEFIAEMMVILSIKEPPHKLVLSELFAVAKDKFEDFSLGEMKLAFRMNTLQELEETTEHYQLFDLKFFSTVLINFRRARSKANQRAKEILPEVIKPVMSISEAEYEWRIVITKQFEQFKETGLLECQFPNQLFDHLEKAGKIVLSDTEKKAIYEQAKSRVVGAKKQKRLNPKNKTELWTLSEFIKRAELNDLRSSEQAEIKQEARRMCIVNYYKTIEKLEL